MCLIFFFTYHYIGCLIVKESGSFIKDEKREELYVCWLVQKKTYLADSYIIVHAWKFLLL